jgi:hypothetical protein
MGSLVQGQLWLAGSPPPETDLGLFTTAELSLIMPVAPGLKDLTARVVKTKSTVLSGVFFIATLQSNGQTPATNPIVTANVKSIHPEPVDGALFSIPADYIKTQPPAPPLGSAN